MSFAFDFARHFFQPRRIGRAGDQTSQLGDDRRFPRWLCLGLADSLQLGPSAAAQGMGGHVSRSFRHGIPCLSRKRTSYSPVAGELWQPRKRGIPEGPPGCRAGRRLARPTVATVAGVVHVERPPNDCQIVPGDLEGGTVAIAEGGDQLQKPGRGADLDPAAIGSLSEKYRPSKDRPRKDRRDRCLLCP